MDSRLTAERWSSDPIMNLSVRVAALEEALTPEALRSAVSRVLLSMVRENGEKDLDVTIERIAERAVGGHEERMH